MFQLHTLSRLTKKRKRVGRGGSRGGSSGRGHKGQLARSGPGLPPNFEGGQMPLSRRLPKRGFNNDVFRTSYRAINIATIERAFEAGETVTKALLIARGIIKLAPSKREQLIKVLGSGELTKKLSIEADAFSQSAIKAIEASGGSWKKNEAAQ